MASALWWVAALVTLPDLIVLPSGDPALATALASALSSRVQDIATVSVSTAIQPDAWSVQPQVAGLDDQARLALQLRTPTGEVVGTWPAIGDLPPTNSITLRLAAVTLEGRLRRLLTPPATAQPAKPAALDTSNNQMWQRFRERRLVVGRAPTVINMGVGWSSGSTAAVREGEYGTVVPWEDLFRRTHREELVSQMRWRKVAKASLAIGGGACVVATGILGGIFLSQLSSQKDPSPLMATAAGGCLLLGITGIVVGSAMDEQPLSPSELEALVDDHNTALRQELGLR